MKRIYSIDGVINICSSRNYYEFYNYMTGMNLRLCKEDIHYFMAIDKSKRFLTSKSHSNFITDNEKKTIKSFLNIKNKRFNKIETLLNHGENVKDVVNIMPTKLLMEYIGDNKWKNL